MNLALWLARAAVAYPDAPAVAEGSSITLSYRGMAKRAASLASAMRVRRSLKEGDRVAIVAKNHPSYFETLFGLWWAGLVAVPVNAKLHPSEVAWILEHSGAKAAFVSADLEAAVRDSTVGDVTVFGSKAHRSLIHGETCDVVARNPDDPAWLFYTSGTTGRPKGATLTHRNLAAMSLGFLSMVDNTKPGDRLLHAAPLSHGSGLYAIPVVANLGVNVVPESGGFDARETLGLMNDHLRSSMFAAPTMIRRLVDCPVDIEPNAIRTLIWGGAPMHIADIARAVDRFGPHLAQIYGQGETPMTISVLSRAEVSDRQHPNWLRRIASAGLPNHVVEIKVASDTQNSSSDSLAPGEVLVKGATVMKGYWDDAAATAAAIDSDGWLHTGDIGVFDGSGYITLLDRATDLIISGGSNIYPREVEEVIAGHPGVRDVAVIGREDAEWGEIVVAYLVGDVDPEELDRLCLEHIARFKRPKDYVSIDTLPTNNYGKILKKELRALDRSRTIAEHVQNRD